MSLLAALPSPQNAVVTYTAPAAKPSTALTVPGRREPPPYMRRQGFVPRRPEDFGDGGAFPEIHVAQYPQDMGRPDKDDKGVKTLAVTINAEGELNFDAIVKQGQNRDKTVHASHKALVPKVDKLKPENLQRPDEEEEEKTAKETLEALSRVVSNKVAVMQPTSLPAQPGEAQYIKYTPSTKGPQHNSGAKQRIIKMQDMPVDPLEPPKFRHKKVPRGPGSPPVPVMHSPPRPVTAQDQADWKIPPSISNWKNPKGYTIPLDKRLAADGRGLQEHMINDRFAALGEALGIAEKKAREAIEIRSRIQKELLTKEKAKKEQELRELAMKARMERVGGGGVATRVDTGVPVMAPEDGSRKQHYYDEEGQEGLRKPQHYESREDRDERQRRDEIREERRRERERERRLEAKDAHGSKKSKITRDRDRDISEKVALGMANVAGGGEVMYDQRLFNQDQGMSSGFGAEDSYTVYDRHLFADRGSNLYRPTRHVDEEEEPPAQGEGTKTDKFRPDRGFKGADVSAGPRHAPVEFERNADEADPFGLDQFLGEATGKRPRKH